jgi:hypothetical protein
VSSLTSKIFEIFLNKEEHPKKFRISRESYLGLDSPLMLKKSPINPTRLLLPSPSRETHPVFSLGKQSTEEGILVTATICSPWQVCTILVWSCSFDLVCHWSNI